MLAGIDQLFVHLVRDDKKVVFHRQRGDLPDQFLWINRAGRVARRVEQQHLRARRDGLFDILWIRQPAVLLARSDDHGHRARQLGQLHVVDKGRLNDDHFVARVQKAENGAQQRFSAAGHHHDVLGGIGLDPIVAQKLVCDGPAQVHRAAVGRIMGVHVLQCPDSGVNDVLGRVKIRLTDLQLHD